MKKLISITLALILSVSVALNCFLVTAVDYPIDNKNASLENNINISGTNSFGNMVADAFVEKNAEQKSNNGYNVFSIEMQNNFAIVNYEALKESTLIVGIYDDDGNQLITTASIVISENELQTIVEFDAKKIPQYFYIKAFLVNTETMRPLCEVYNCPTYTEEMQKFLKKTVNDFDSELVLNLDNDITTNFVVYNEDTVLINNVIGVNNVISANDNDNVYVIENADNNITSLKHGDIFSYQYGEDKLMIVKVDTITINGNTASIIGENVELEEVFDYIKIEEATNGSEANVEESSLGDGVEYLGKDETSTRALGGEGDYSIGLKFALAKKFEKNNEESINISAEIGVKSTASYKIYYTPHLFSKDEVYVEFVLKNKFHVKVGVSGKLESDEDDFKLAEIHLFSNAFLDISYILRFSVEAEVEIFIEGDLERQTGYAYDSSYGTRDLSSEPKYTSDGFEFEGKIFFGFVAEIKCKVRLLNIDIASVSLEGKAGIELKCAPEIIERDDKADSMHMCTVCSDGDIHAKFSLKVKIKVLDFIKTDINIGELRIKIVDFYYSSEKGFGFGKCKNYNYKLTINVSGADTLEGAAILINDTPFQSEVKKTQSLILPTGKYVINVILSDGREYKLNEEIKDKAVTAYALFLKNSSDGSISSGTVGFDSNGDVILPPLGSNKIKQVSSGYTHSVVLTVNGDLYMWGHTDSGQTGTGFNNSSTTPVKIMSNVASVSLGDRHSAAITNDGGLYLWGDNSYGQIGNGNTENIEKPIKIMDNIMSVSLGNNHSAAITTDGSLYLWGNNEYGQLGDETLIKRLTPVKILDNISKVSLGQNFSAAITKDKTLYMWGNNEYGQLGTGTKVTHLSPVKVLENVDSVSCGYSHCIAVTSDGSLYAWGDNSCGQLGNATNLESLRPQKIMDNVKIASAGYLSSEIITSDNNLYACGRTGDWGITTIENTNTYKNVANDIVSASCSKHTLATDSNGKLYVAGNIPYSSMVSSGTPLKTHFISFTEINLNSNINLLRSDDIYENYSIMPCELTNNTSYTFNNLIPNEIYNCYGLKSRKTDNPFDNDNLLFITQYISDENGNLTFSYCPIEDYSNPEIFVKAKTEFSVGNAQISNLEIDNGIANITWQPYSNAQQYKIHKIINGVFIEEQATTGTNGIIKELMTDYTYGFIIQTCVNGEWSILNSSDIVYASLFEDMKEVLKGDLNFDGKVNNKDLILLRVILTTEDIDKYKDVADMNNDGKINNKDLVLLRLALSKAQ